ncbi:MAG: hypothetical protein AAB456_00480 [Patescibacteria group bacterium]
MLKNLTQLEHKIEDKVCRFICDNDTSIAIAKEALFQFSKYLGQIEDAAKAQQVIKEAKEPDKQEDKSNAV